MTRKKKLLKRAGKRTEKYKKETNDTAISKLTKAGGQHNCPICPPWRGENQVARVPKRGAKKPRHKDKRG